MTMKTEPFLSGKYGWDLGENNWKDGADENFLKFSYLLNRNVDGFVSTLPSSPVNGTAYFLTTDNTLNARVDGAWFKYATPRGFTVTDKATGDKYEFNGTAFVATLNSVDKVKLNGITAGATVNATDASLRDRATHTGSQAIATVTGLQSALNTKAPSDNPTFTGTVTAPTAPVGDNNTKVATTAFVKSQNYLTSASAGLVTSVATRTGDVILVKADVGLNNVDNTPDSGKPVSTAQQTALNLKANLVSPTFTVSAVLPSNTTIGSITSTELGYLAGVTSNVQAQINSLSGSSGAFAPINNPTFTGTVNGITKAMVGLSNVDNTSDVSKPISTATQTALNAKQAALSGSGFIKISGTTITYDNSTYASTASPTFTGTVVLPSTTSIGAVTGTQIGYLVNTTSDIQTQLNNKVGTTAPTFQSAVTVNAASGQSSLYLSQAGVNNGRIWAGGGGGLDVNIDSGRDIGLNATNSVAVSVGGSLKYTFGATNFILPTSGRITGDFSNSVISSRVLVQSNVADSVTRFDVIPSGTATTSTLGAFNNSDPTNAAWVRLTATSSDVRVESTTSGTGTVLPLSFYTNGVSRVSISTAGVVSLPSTTTIGSVTSAQLGYLVNTTSDIQSQINGKQASLGYTPANKAGDTITGSLDIAGTLSASGGTNLYSTGLNVLSLNTGNISGQLTLSVTGTAKGYITWATSGFNFYDANANTRISITNGQTLINGLAGDGSSLTNLNATNISSGTVSDSRLPSTMTGKEFNSLVRLAYTTPHLQIRDTSNTFSTMISYISFQDSTQVEKGWMGFGAGNGSLGITSLGGAAPIHLTGSIVYAPEISSTGRITTSVGFTGDGALITGINATNISSGTLSVLRLPFTLASTNTNSAVVQRDGAGSFQANVITATHVGDGAGLTGLNGSSITIGTISAARLPSGTTSAAGVVQLTTSTSSTSTTLAPTASALKSVQDQLTTVSNVQDSMIENPFQDFVSLGTVSGAQSPFANHILATVNGNTTWTFVSPTSTRASAITLELTNGGAYTMTWPAGTRWAGGVAPTLTASGTDILVFTKAGTNAWRGYLSSKDNK